MNNKNQPPLQVRIAIRLLNYSIRTEQSYVGWIKRYIYFHNKQHPKLLAENEVKTFLTHLAIEDNVAPNTQNQAYSALIFLYKHVINQPLDEIKGLFAQKRKLDSLLYLKPMRLKIDSVIWMVIIGLPLA